MYPFQVAESSSKKDGNDFVIFEIIQIKCETKTHNEIVKLNDMRFWVFGCKEESERKRQKMRGGCSFSVGYLRLTCSLKKKKYLRLTWFWGPNIDEDQTSTVKWGTKRCRLVIASSGKLWCFLIFSVFKWKEMYKIEFG